MNILQRAILKVFNICQLHATRIQQQHTPLTGYTEHQLHIPGIERLPDEELARLNELLPWGSFVVDSKGRRFGRPYSSDKRNEPQIIPNYRIVELDKRYPLSELSVLELGCFEGNHTCALASLAKHVTALDSRVENLVKTVVRCALFGHKPDVIYCDLEKELPSNVDLSCDVLHHVGVLYHLTNPVGHLYEISPFVRKAMMLDTHIAPEGIKYETDVHKGVSYQYMNYREGGRAAPFAGMKDHAKWLREHDLVRVLTACGFAHIDIAERRDERNGPRLLIYAHR